MRPPRTLRIFGQRVEVRMAKGAAEDVSIESHLGEWVHESDEHSNVGAASMRFGRIGIDPRQSIDQQKDTFLHEALHIMLMQAQADDEDTVFRLSPILLDFLRRNPRAVAYLTERT